MYFRDVLPTVRYVDKTKEMKYQAICMNPVICNVCVCPHCAKLLFFQVCLLQTFLILLGCSTSLLRLLRYSTSAQGVFEIQVKIFDPPSFGITKNLLLMNEDIKEYKIQVPSSMLFANGDIKEYTIQVPSSMTLLQNAPFRHLQSMCRQ
jgi:hypothetical protein